MLFGRIGQAFGLELCQCADDAEARVARFDDIVDIPYLAAW